jgi:Tetrahydrofolate dehydrogenase/cyclohydrolase, catalytic domain
MQPTEEVRKVSQKENCFPAVRRGSKDRELKKRITFGSQKVKGEEGEPEEEELLSCSRRRKRGNEREEEELLSCSQERKRWKKANRRGAGGGRGQVVSDYNADPQVHGILVQLPLPKHIDEQRVLDAISIEKDVDGFHPANIGALAMRGRTPLFTSCTPKVGPAGEVPEALPQRDWGGGCEAGLRKWGGMG